jgi:hypothetical protein
MLPVIFLAFANDASRPLDNLVREHRELEKLLLSRNNRDFSVQFDPYATIDTVSQKLRTFQGGVAVFHFSGHAWKDRLTLTDQDAFAEGLAMQMKNQKSLGLVFLNGCGTDGHVEGLLNMGVPAVIATDNTVPDEQAADFAIEFYRNLAVPYATIEEAFEEAKAFLAFKYQQAKPVMRGALAFKEARKKGELLWGLYTQDDDSAAKKWYLPVQEVLVQEIPQPNEHLVNELFKAWVDKSPEIKDLIAEKKRKNEKVNFEDKRFAVLNSLPSPISEQLRKLMAPTGEETKAGFDKHGMQRLLQMLVAYNTSMELMTFVMLAQLWQEVKAGNIQRLPSDVEAKMREFFHRSFFRVPGQELLVDGFFYIRLIRGVREMLDEKKIAYFVSELADLRKFFEENGTFRHASDFFESLKKRLVNRLPAPSEAIQLCVAGERYLTNFFEPMSFWANYKLLSIANIDLMKLRHYKSPNYKHWYFPLDYMTTGAQQEKKDRTYEQFSDCKSVIIVKSLETVPDNLNLSPFIIDQNSYEANAEKSKLLFFKSMSSTASSWQFRYNFVKIQKDEVPITISRDGTQAEEWEEASIDPYQDVKDQWEDIAQTFFKHPLDDITRQPGAG